MKSFHRCFIKQGLVSLVIAGLTVCNAPILSVAAQSSAGETGKTDVLLEDQKKEKVDTGVRENHKVIITEDPAFVVTDPSVTVDSGEGVDGMTLLYIGGGVGLLAIGVMALGGGSGSSSDSESTSISTTTPVEDGSGSGSTSTPSTAPVVGPDLNGANWGGYLNIKDNQAQGFQNITATIVQNGSAVQISTTSTLQYGRLFTGSIKSNGFMLMYDSVTGEDWTTHYSNATATNVDLYDYVNNLKDLDRMLLIR